MGDSIEAIVEREDLIVKYLDYLSQVVTYDDYVFGHEGIAVLAAHVVKVWHGETTLYAIEY